VLRDWPANEVFEDLRDWLMPRAESGSVALGAQIVEASESVWEPVGTPEEYLDVNLCPPDLPRLGGPAAAWQGPIEVVGRSKDVVRARSVRLPADVELSRCVVWDGATVPAGASQRDGVFGARGFYATDPTARSKPGVETVEQSRGAA